MDLEKEIRLLMKKYKKFIFQRCFFKLNDVTLAEEACSEAFFRYAERLKKKYLPKIKKSKQYLTKTADNVCYDFLKKKIKEKNIIVHFEDLNEKDKKLVEQYDTSNSDKSIYKLDQLIEVVPVLTNKERQVVRFKYVYGMTYKEISEITGIKEGTLKSMIFNSINKIIDYVKKTPSLMEDWHELFRNEK